MYAPFIPHYQFRGEINGANKNSCYVPSLSAATTQREDPLEGRVLLLFPTLFGVPMVNEGGEMKALRFITLRKGVLRRGISSSLLG